MLGIIVDQWSSFHRGGTCWSNMDRAHPWWQNNPTLTQSVLQLGMLFQPSIFAHRCCFRKTLRQTCSMHRYGFGSKWGRAWNRPSCDDLVVSWNRGTPKSSILTRFFPYKPSIFGLPAFMETPMVVLPKRTAFLGQPPLQTDRNIHKLSLIFRRQGKTRISVGQHLLRYIWNMSTVHLCACSVHANVYI